MSIFPPIQLKKNKVLKIQLPGVQYAFKNIAQVPQEFLLIAKFFAQQMAQLYSAWDLFGNVKL